MNVAGVDRSEPELTSCDRVRIGVNSLLEEICDRADDGRERLPVDGADTRL